MYLIWLQSARPDGLTEDLVAELADALADIEDADPAVSGIDVAASLASGTVDVQMSVVAPDADQALAKVQETIRDAIHAIGDFAPGLPATRLHARACASLTQASGRTPAFTRCRVLRSVMTASCQARPARP